MCAMAYALGHCYERGTKHKPAKSSELRLQRVGGKSETEFVVNWSLSSIAAKSKRQNLLLATQSAEEKEAMLRACILQPIVLI